MHVNEIEKQAHYRACKQERNRIQYSLASVLKEMRIPNNKEIIKSIIEAIKND
jgi:hypothetical protein